MSIVDELSRLNELREEGALTDGEYEAAKRDLLRTPDDRTAGAEEIDSLRSQVDQVHREQQVILIDRDWEEERKQYLIRTRYGTYVAPTVSDAITVTVFAVVIGVLMLVMFSQLSQSAYKTGTTVTVDGVTSDCGDPDLSPVARSLCAYAAPQAQISRTSQKPTGKADLLGFVGIVLILAGIASGVSSYSKATAYNEALAAYQDRRSALVAQLGGRDG